MDLPASVMTLTGAASVRELGEGHQSRVFELTMADRPRLVAKVVDAAAVDADIVIARVDAVAELADIDARVCRPVAIARRLVNPISDDDGGSWLLLCSEFADGVAFDVTATGDAALMGATLAGLHRSLALVVQRGIPEVAALRTVGSELGGDVQLLHGDFNTGNLRRRGATVKVFDFEDCGYGPRAFEIANALYMVLFTETIDGRAAQYPEFEDAFLAGYAAEDSCDVDRHAVDGFLDLRVLALERWLDDLPTAPIGIRTATPEWHETLRFFTTSYRRRQDDLRDAGPRD